MRLTLIILLVLLSACGGGSDYGVFEAGLDNSPSAVGGGPVKQAEVTVHASRSWQDTGIIVYPDQEVTVQYLRGQWSVNSFTGPTGAGGNPRFIARPLYALPGAPEAALIGRVGERVFLIGNGGVVPEGITGPLELVINDDLLGLYGQGLFDNAGSIDILITASTRDLVG